MKLGAIYVALVFSGLEDLALDSFRLRGAGQNVVVRDHGFGTADDSRGVNRGQLAIPSKEVDCSAATIWRT